MNIRFGWHEKKVARIITLSSLFIALLIAFSANPEEPDVR